MFIFARRTKKQRRSYNVAPAVANNLLVALCFSFATFHEISTDYQYSFISDNPKFERADAHLRSS